MIQLEGLNRTYQIIQKIGNGSTSEVFLGIDAKTNSQFAIKKIGSKQLINDRENLYFKKEIDNLEYLKNIERHPNILAIEEIINDVNNDELVYVVQEYCSEGDLFDFLSKHSHELDLESKLAFSIQLASGIQFLHSKNIIHRDLKPENCFITKSQSSTSILQDSLHKNYCLKIGDFGISKINHLNEPMKSLVGTPIYMPPEIYKNQEYSFSFDIWSLGCIIFEIFTSNQLIKGVNIMEIYRNTVNHDSSKMVYLKDFQEAENINEIIKNCLVTDLQQRIHINELLHRLNTCYERVILQKNKFLKSQNQQINVNHVQLLSAEMNNFNNQNNIYEIDQISATKTLQTQNYLYCTNPIISTDQTQQVMINDLNTKMNEQQQPKPESFNYSKNNITQSQNLFLKKPESQYICQKEMKLEEDDCNSEPYLYLPCDDLNMNLTQKREVNQCISRILSSEEDDIIKINKIKTTRKDDQQENRTPNQQPITKSFKIFGQKSNIQHNFLTNNQSSPQNYQNQQYNNTLSLLVQIKNLNSEKQSIYTQNNNLHSNINKQSQIKSNIFYPSLNSNNDFQKGNNSLQSIVKQNNDISDKQLIINSPLTPINNINKIYEANMDLSLSDQGLIQKNKEDTNQSQMVRSRVRHNSQFNLIVEGFKMRDSRKRKNNKQISNIKNKNKIEYFRNRNLSEHTNQIQDYHNNIIKKIIFENKKNQIQNLNKSLVKVEPLTIGKSQFYIQEFMIQHCSQLKDQMFVKFNSFTNNNQNEQQKEFNIAYCVNFMMAQIILADEILQNNINLVSKELEIFKNQVCLVKSNDELTDFIQLLSQKQVSSTQKLQKLFELSDQHKELLNKINILPLRNFLEKQKQENPKIKEYIEQKDQSKSQEYFVNLIKQSLNFVLIINGIQNEYYVDRLKRILMRNEKLTLLNKPNYIQQLKNLYLEENSFKSAIQNQTVKSVRS